MTSTYRAEPLTQPSSGWELLRAARGGDRDAFAEFYRRYRPIAIGQLYARGVGSNDVEDLTSEVFLRAWRNLHTVTEQRDDPGAWLSTIARNLATDRARSAAHRLTTPVADVAETGQHAPVTTSAESLALERIERAETTARVRALVAGLRPDYRQSLVAFLADRSHDEEAARTGGTVGGSKTRRVRALRAARAALTGEVAA